MALTSVSFLLFLAVICITAYVVPAKYRYVWLLICSYAFYLYDANGNYLKNMPALLMMLGATFISYLCAFVISKSTKKHVKVAFLVLTLVSTLGMLFACKYLDFFLEGIGVLASGTSLNLVLPLGISYYTLQTVGYAVDVYCGTQQAEKNLLKYALFVSFFPGLVTGPINSADKMLPQYTNPPKFNYAKVSGGLFRVLWGIFKKMLIADNLGVFTSSIFGDLPRHNGPAVVLAVLIFSYQIYIDFSACCDIAVGAARMLGFKFTENFNRPFAAKTYPALWQRWHISLTTFLRDYLFMPVSWSRWTQKLPKIGKFFTKPPVVSTTILVFAVSGLWHGANINYVIWGLLNGVIMMLAQRYGKKREKFMKKIPLYGKSRLRGFFQRIFVYLTFSFCLIFFSSAIYNFSSLNWFASLGKGWADGNILKNLLIKLGYNGINTQMLIVLVCAVLLVELIEKFAITQKSSIAHWVRKRNVFVRWLLYYGIICALLMFGAFGQSSFIYQQY